jgi:hypothetical protein
MESYFHVDYAFTSPMGSQIFENILWDVLKSVFFTYFYFQFPDDDFSKSRNMQQATEL